MSDDTSRFGGTSQPVRDGYYEEYRVSRLDGLDIPPGRYQRARYLVLDLTNSLEARDAALHYCDVLRGTRPLYAQQLEAIVNSLATEHPLEAQGKALLAIARKPLTTPKENV